MRTMKERILEGKDLNCFSFEEILIKLALNVDSN